MAETTGQDGSLGIFELADDGTVSYASFEQSDSWLGAEQDINGRDFFSEVLGFSNVSDLRRRFENFKAEAIPACSFDFVCQFQHQAVPVRVLLARLCDRRGNQPTSILVHLRRSSATPSAISASTERF